MHDSDQFVVFVHHWHRHDTVLFHAIDHRARELTQTSHLGLARHDPTDGSRPEVLAALDEPAEISRSQYPIDVCSCVHDDGDATTLRYHDDCLPHGVSIPEDGQLIAEHDILDLRHERATQGAPRMDSRKVLPPEALLLE